MIELRWLKSNNGTTVLQYCMRISDSISTSWQTVPVVREERRTGATKGVGCGGDERRKESVTPYVEKGRPQRLPVFRDTVFTADEDARVERRKGERRVAPFNIEASLELNRRHCDDRRAEKPTGAQETEPGHTKNIARHIHEFEESIYSYAGANPKDGDIAFALKVLGRRDMGSSCHRLLVRAVEIIHMLTPQPEPTAPEE